MSACLSFWGEKIPDTTPTFPAKPMDLDLARERGLLPLPNQGRGSVVIEKDENYELDGL
jgi:hypothetical protein